MQYQFDGERERRAEFAMPKRTKQMGGIEQRLRIFVEDYVYTYLYQYGRSGGGAEKLAALVGKYYELEGQRVLLISGAIQAKGTVQEGGTERFGDETWEYIGGQLQQYFKGMTVVGWVHCQPGFGAFLTAKDEQFHREYFKEDWQVLFAMDTVDRLDSFYLYNEDGRGLRQARGYFVYYDRNREMQEYMLDNSMIRPREEAAEIETVAEQPKEGARRRKKPTPNGSWPSTISSPAPATIRPSASPVPSRAAGARRCGSSTIWPPARRSTLPGPPTVPPTRAFPVCSAI